MRKRIRTLLAAVLLVAGSAAYAQAPTWLNSEMRAVEYPQASYYVGYVVGNVKPNESTETATQRLKKEAMAEAANTVRVKVQNTTSSLLQSVQVKSAAGLNEQVNTTFSSATTTTTDMELPALKTEVYRDPQTREIHAIAYTRKQDVINYFDKQITIGLAKLEAKLQTVEQLMDLGQKIQARKTAESSLEILATIDAAQKMLTAADPNVSSESLQMQQVVALGRELMGKLVALTQGVNVYIESRELNFGQNTDVVATNLKNLMSKDCSFVDNEAEADYKISLEGKTRQSTEDENIKVCFVDVKVSVFDVSKGKVVYTNSFTDKGLEPTWHRAGTTAYKKAAAKVNEAVKPFIK